MKMGESQLTYNDVITSHVSGNFDRKTINIPTLAVEVQPGSCIKSDGTAYTSGDDCLLVLSHHRAGDDANIIVADRLIYIRPETVTAVMGATVGAAAIAALTKSGNVRIALADK
ncbi:Bacteriophage lambda head decoration protein D [Kosakonia sp. BK9b]